MKKIILITSCFPYFGGEQFLETEVHYYKNFDLTIMPKTNHKDIRKIPSNVKVDNFLIEKSCKKNRMVYLLKSFKTDIFYKELLSEISFNLNKMKIFLSSMATYQMYYEIFDSYFYNMKNLENLVVYTYWNDEATYALQKLKNKYEYILISRVHGGDLYRERKPFEYMPLKKQFVYNLDAIYTITQSANEYLNKTYGFDKSILKLGRLGVEDLSIISLPSEKNKMYIVSCSFLTEVKQVDKIIKSLEILSDKMKHIDFKWSHIGDGILYEKLLQLAKEKLKDKKNVKFEFLGNIDNQKVYEFYRNNSVDAFINVSKSEGVPVSIMEAMSCHIPIVAPDVGGISDMIEDRKNGILLSEECDIDEIVEAIGQFGFFKDKKVRDNAYEIFLDRYDARKNYKSFVKEIGSLK
jgi:glycosyltransferase involved in cell wall biosynthesis